MAEDVYADDTDTTPYIETDDGNHRPHVGDAIALFGDLRDFF